MSLLDPGDEGDRTILIRADHPEYYDDALEAEYEPGVDEHNPRLHLIMHEVVANQIWADEPPAAWRTAQRLSHLGYERHEVLHMLGSAAADQLWHSLSEQRPFDPEAHAATLDALPESWEAEQDEEELDDDELDDDELDDDELDDDEVDRFVLPWPPTGTTFTHPLTEVEVANQVIAWSVDLDPLGPLVQDHGHLHLAGGEVAEVEHHPALGRVLAGPPRWLERFGPGELVGLRTSDDEVELMAVNTTEVPRGLAEALGPVFDRENEGNGMPILVPELVNGALAGLPAPPAMPLPPVGTLLGELGFEDHEGYAAPVGTDWEAFDRTQRLVRAVALRGLEAAEIRAVTALSKLYAIVVSGSVELADLDLGEAALTEAALALANPHVGEAFVDVISELSGPDDEGAGLVTFVGALMPLVTRRERAGLVWLASVGARRSGDHVAAEEALRQALDLDPEHPLAVEEAAWYANDRGNARRAVELLSRLEDPDAEERASVLAPYAVAPPRPLVGRNDRCPCGSGRKFKVCCLNADRQVPLPDRVGWIWTKLEWFLERSGFQGDVDELLEALGSFESEDEHLVVSLVLFHDGAIDRFLAERGPLLPDDERNLVAQWALIDRSVYEVVEVMPGAGVVLRDIRTGDVVDVRERSASTQVRIGDLIFAHVVPDGHAHQLVGGVMTVPLRLRDQLVDVLDTDHEAVDVVMLLAAGLGPAHRADDRG